MTNKIKETETRKRVAWADKCSAREYLEHFVQGCGKTQFQLAKLMGFASQASIARLISKTHYQAPALDNFFILADAIGADPVKLRTKIFRERMPEYYAWEQRAGIRPTTAVQREVLDMMEEMGVERPFTDEQKEKLKKFFSEKLTEDEQRN